MSTTADRTQTKRGSSPFLALIPSLIVNGALPTLAYFLLTGHGWSSFAALLAGAVFPVAWSIISFVRSRSLDALSVLVFIFLVLGIVSSFIIGSPVFYLAKESVFTGLFGVVFAASLLFPRPLAFYVGRQFATGGVPARVEEWNGLWQYAGFRHNQRVITSVWAASFIGEAVLKVVFVLLLPVSTMVWLGQVLAYGAIAATMLWTFAYTARARARARARGYTGDI